MGAYRAGGGGSGRGDAIATAKVKAAVAIVIAYHSACGYSPIRRAFSMTSEVTASTVGVGMSAARAKAWTEVKMPSISGGRSRSKSCSIEDLCGEVGRLP